MKYYNAKKLRLLFIVIHISCIRKKLVVILILLAPKKKVKLELSQYLNIDLQIA